MKILLASLLLLALSACSKAAYYTQLAQGQMELLRARVPITELLAAADTGPALRARLRAVQHARRFASEVLALPDNDSYTDYAALPREFVVWNVFATPELSLTPVEHCFLLVGCLAYRGYFDEAAAQAQAEALRAQGLDVHVGGVAAYSTLGWFDDPVISTMLRWDDATLIGTLFHELAHQWLFVDGDTAFNESLASFVEQEGLRQYHAAHGGPPPDFAKRQQRQRQFTQLMLSARERLTALYASERSETEKRSGKAAEFARLRADYTALRDGEWSGWAGYEGWFASAINNARLLPFGLYDEWVPAFAALYAQGDGWTDFYVAAEALAALPLAQRQQALRALLAR